jgi:methionyl-tRNA formyltransferase
MKICIAGRNELAVECLKYLLDYQKVKKRDIIVVCSKFDLGVDNWQPSLKNFCIKNQVPIVEIEDLYKIDNLFFFSLQFDKIIRTGKFKSKNLFNIHFSLLPKYKGMYTSVIPILRGESHSGVTLHLIDEGIDTGNIIDQIKIPIKISDCSRHLYFKYIKNGLYLFQKNFDKLITGNFEAATQPNINSSYFSKTSVDFKNIIIDLNKTSYEIHNQIRAFIFKEYQLPKVGNYYITKSTLTKEIIGRNSFIEMENEITIAGIDAYKIILIKDKCIND